MKKFLKFQRIQEIYLKFINVYYLRFRIKFKFIYYYIIYIMNERYTDDNNIRKRKFLRFFDFD